MSNGISFEADTAAAVAVAPAAPAPASVKRSRAERNRTAEVATVDEATSDVALDEREAVDLPTPLFLRRSGIYRIVRPPTPPATPDPVPALSNGAEAPIGPNSLSVPFPLFGTEDLRVDIDGFMPAMTVSGTITRLFGGRLTWIARVTKNPATGAWTGPIRFLTPNERVARSGAARSPGRRRRRSAASPDLL